MSRQRESVSTGPQSTMEIIGKPPAPKRGATFADVPVGAAFVREGQKYRGALVRLEVFSVPGGYLRNAVEVRTGELLWVPPGAPVTLLAQPTPVEPEPDPSVTTYGELEPGETFSFRVAPEGLCQRTDEGHVYEGTAVTGIDPKMPVLPVPASLVVHEKPGKWVSEDGHFLHHGSAFKLTVETATAMARQLVALLAQHDAKPDTPAEELVDGGDGQGWCPVCETEQEGHPCLHPKSEVEAKKPNTPAEPADRRVAECWRDLAGPARGLVLIGGAVMLSTPDDSGIWRYSRGSTVSECRPYADFLPDPDAPTNWGMWATWSADHAPGVEIPPFKRGFAKELLRRVQASFLENGRSWELPPSALSWVAGPKQKTTDADG